MNKIVIALIAALAFIVTARAETDYVAMEVIKDIQAGNAGANQIRVLRVSEDAILPAGSIGNAELATISTAGKVADAALSTNVTLLGQTIESSEITAGTIVDSDISASAAIAGSKLNLGGVEVTNVIISADAKTNTIIAIDGVITSWTVGE